MGRIGMSLDDFDRCTPMEFSRIVEKCNERELQYARTGWEQTRFLALTNLQPYCKKQLKESDIMVFPWEKSKRDMTPKGTSSIERVREIMERLEKHKSDVKNQDAS